MAMRKLILSRRHFLAVAGTALSAPALAFPTAGKPLRILVGYPAGGGTDLQARLLGQHMSPLLGVSVIVENRAGAGTMIAATELARSAPDGHTIMYTPASTITQLPHTLLAAKYDPQRDFTPVAQCALGPNVLVLHKSVPANDLNELIAYAKKRPGELNYVSQGIGTSAHVFGEMLAKQAGIQIVHVPYKGAADVAKDFLAGRVHLQFASSSAAQALARSGEVRLLGVVAPRRSDLFPELKTMSELGIQGMDIDTSLGLLGPAGMAPPVVARIADAARTVIGLPQVRTDFRTGGVEPLWAGPADYAQTLRDAHTGWGKLLAAVGYKRQ